MWRVVGTGAPTGTARGVKILLDETASLDTSLLIPLPFEAERGTRRRPGRYISSVVKESFTTERD